MHLFSHRQKCGSNRTAMLELKLSRRMGKPTICISENKGADQLRSNCEADQRLCFCYTDSTIPLLSKSKIFSFQPSSVTVQPSLCRTWSEPELLVFSCTGSIESDCSLDFFCATVWKTNIFVEYFNKGLHCKGAVITFRALYSKHLVLTFIKYFFTF